MDYLAQAKMFLQRAKHTQQTDEKEAHLTAAAEMLEKAITAYENPSELSWQERDALEIFRSKNARPNQKIGVLAIQQAWNVAVPTAELWAGMKGLQQKGFVDGDQHAFWLTDAGYRMISG
ncbi:MAG: hypothetical protein P4L80_18990 [Xanthobacteraceae bacterium]|nr:hypothetical protein [Xanthobacteraceae bacterium]